MMPNICILRKTHPEYGDPADHDDQYKQIMDSRGRRVAGDQNIEKLLHEQRGSKRGDLDTDRSDKEQQKEPAMPSRFFKQHPENIPGRSCRFRFIGCFHIFRQKTGLRPKTHLQSISARDSGQTASEQGASPTTYLKGTMRTKRRRTGAVWRNPDGLRSFSRSASLLLEAVAHATVSSSRLAFRKNSSQRGLEVLWRWVLMETYERPRRLRNRELL